MCERKSVFVCSDSDILDMLNSFVWYVLVFGIFKVLPVLTVHTCVGLFLVLFLKVLTVLIVLVRGVYFA